MTLSLEGKTKLAISVTFLVLFLNGLLSYRSLDTLEQGERRVEQSHAVLAAIETMLSTMKDAETGERGFVITGDDAYLAPYAQAVARIHEELADLRRLVADHPAQQAQLALIDQQVAARLDRLAQVIAARKRGDAAGARQLVRGGHGKEVMDELLQLAGLMEADEQARLQRRAAESQANRRNAFWTLVAATSIAALLVVMVGLVLHRGIVAQRRGERQASLLARTAAALSSPLEYRRTLASLAQMMVPEIADACAIFLIEDGKLNRAGLAPADAALQQVATEIARRPPIDLSAGTDAASQLRTGRPALYTQIADAELAAWARDPEQLRVLRELAPGSAMVCPMTARGQLLGLIAFVTTAASGRRYATPDLASAAAIAERAGIGVDQARLYQNALQSNRIKDQFLATLSHELRTPLNAIMGWTHMLRAGDLDPERTRKAIEVIDRNAKAQTQLIGDVLDVSSIVSGKLRMDVEAIDLVEAIRSAVDALRPAAEGRRVQLELILDPGAGAISGDRHRLQQVVWNLVSNAVKFAPARGHVQVRLEAVSSHVLLTVEDDGPGIDPSFLPHIFERFTQADASSTRQHGGLGLGLAIVRHIVELHGGTVSAENRPQGRGAILTVRLPRRTLSAPPAPERSTADARVSPAAASLAGIKVLYVDDDVDSRTMVATILRLHAAKVSAVASADEALESLRRERPDVFLLDIEMPDTDGYTLLARIQQQLGAAPGSIAAAALTGYASTQDRLSALAAGFRMHIPKPVNPDELVVVVASLAGRFPSREGSA